MWRIGFVGSRCIQRATQQIIVHEWPSSVFFEVMLPGGRISAAGELLHPVSHRLISAAVFYMSRDKMIKVWNVEC